MNKERERQYRDFFSHSTSGKNEDYLNLNQTVDHGTIVAEVVAGAPEAVHIDPDQAKTAKGAVAAVTQEVSVKKREQQSLSVIFKEAGERALGGGLPGAAAMAIQVGSLMWLRTTMNYQYRYGTDTMTALKTLYKEGGIPRFYRGIGPALIQGPLSRFGDTASNAAALSLLDAFEATKEMPTFLKSVCASGMAAAFRINLVPIDTVKTIMQVEGKNGLPALMAKIRAHGPLVLYSGALASAAATFSGHLPWFATHNMLNANLPQADKGSISQKLLRNAFMGFCASAVSDTVSNSLRVVKTYKQTSTTPVSYVAAAKDVIAKDGLVGLFGRGLSTRILANGLQGALFSVLWKQMEDALKRRESLESHDLEKRLVEAETQVAKKQKA